jgi:hypothetical protein
MLMLAISSSPSGCYSVASPAAIRHPRGGAPRILPSLTKKESGEKSNDRIYPKFYIPFAFSSRRRILVDSLVGRMDGIPERNTVYAAVGGAPPQLRSGLAHHRAHSESVERVERLMRKTAYSAFKCDGFGFDLACRDVA